MKYIYKWHWNWSEGMVTEASVLQADIPIIFYSMCSWWVKRKTDWRHYHVVPMYLGIRGLTRWGRSFNVRVPSSITERKPPTPLFLSFFTAAIFLEFQTYFDKICFELKIQTLHVICKGDNGLSYRTTFIFLTFSI